MKVMISQPMFGKTSKQIRKERKNVVAELEKQGYEVVDTIFSENAPRDCDEVIYYLAKSIEAMSKVDGVVFMKGWEDARGCKIEYQIAVSYGRFIKIL